MIATAFALTITAASPITAASVFDARMRQSVAAARALDGPLEGRWTLYAGVKALYVFQIVDRAGDGAKLEAAWRDPCAGQDEAGVGVVTLIARVPGGLRLSFSRIGAGLTGVRLRGDPIGGWRGRMIQSGHETRVTLRPDNS